MGSMRDGGSSPLRDDRMPEWQWELVDHSRINASGDFAKMFRGERVKSPGVFGADPLEDESALLMREAVQNSWDAAIETRAETGEQEPHPFEVSFRLFELWGEERDRIAGALGLGDLAHRVESVDSRQILGLGEKDCLSDGFAGDIPLPMLEIREQAAGGMHGPWSEDSKLLRAMCTIGMTPATPDRGGSFGYGKAGLIRGSRVRTVVAYTCFAERPDDEGVTRRLLGMTYWGSHRHEGCSYTGARWFACLGNGPEPCVNEAADQVASLLGLPLRDPAEVSDRGTTMLLVDPTVTADGLVRAAERFWWPALEDGSLQFGLVVKDDTARSLHHPRPKRNPDLLPFIEAFEAAMMRQDHKRSELQVYDLKPRSTADGYDRFGKLALRSDRSGWSYPETLESPAEDAGEVEHRSLVALIRDPRMVVEYYDTGARGSPYIRGAFVADSAINERLRLTENKAHDTWQTSSAAGDIATADAEAARLLLQQVRSRVREYRGEVRPKPKPYAAMRFPVWDELARMLWRGAAPGDRPPPRPARALSIQPGEQLAVGEDGRPYVEGAASIGYSDSYTPEHPEGDLVEVSLRCNFAAIDGSRQQHTVPLDVETPRGFVPQEGSGHVFQGRIKPGHRVTFEYLTGEYDSYWTVEVDVSAEIVAEDHFDGTESPD